MKTYSESHLLAVDWFRKTCDMCVDYVEANITLVNLAKSGIGMTLGRADFLKALDGYHEVYNPEKRVQQKELEAAHVQAALAQSEIDSDFRLLHAHSLVGIWGAVDAWVDDVVAGWLLNRPDCFELGDRKVKVSCSTVLSDPLTRTRFVAAALRDSLGYSLRLGVTPMEEFFASVGLSGFVPSEIGDAVFEAQQIRNVYAHNGGRADERLLERCPRLGLSRGVPVPVTSDMYYGYAAAFIRYVSVVWNRGKEKEAS